MEEVEPGKLRLFEFLVPVIEIRRSIKGDRTKYLPAYFCDRN